uniref:hypothetical protein n=1 Tax=Allorhizocola rhizosphaerae TaxID=1872709 RepID=UPI001B8D46F3
MTRILARAGTVGVVAGLSVATELTPVWADNCSGLSDCLFTIAAALLVVALLALLIAFLIGSGGTGMFAFAGLGGAFGSSAAASAAAAWWTSAAISAAQAAAA